VSSSVLTLQKKESNMSVGKPPRADLQIRIAPELLLWLRLFSISSSFDANGKPTGTVSVSDSINRAVEMFRSHYSQAGFTEAKLIERLQALELKHGKLIKY